MKKIFLIAAMLIASVSAFSHSLREVVYLKNGSIVKGDIVEFQPDKLIKMETADGSLFVFEYNDIEKITRERVCCDYHPVYDEPTEVSYDNASFLNRGYRGFVSVETLLGDFIGCGITTTHGKQVNEKFFVGGGVGMFIAEDWMEDHYSFPVYAALRVDFLNKKISPFMGLRTGIDFAAEGPSGFYGDFSFGCRFKRSSVSFGINTMRGNYYDSDDIDRDYYYDCNEGIFYYDCSDFYYRAFNFVTRFSFEF